MGTVNCELSSITSLHSGQNITDCSSRRSSTSTIDIVYLLCLSAAVVLDLPEALHVQPQAADARHAAVGLLDLQEGAMFQILAPKNSVLKSALTHRLPVVAGDVVEDLGDVGVLVGGDVRLVGVPADVER